MVQGEATQTELSQCADLGKQNLERREAKVTRIGVAKYREDGAARKKTPGNCKGIPSVSACCACEKTNPLGKGAGRTIPRAHMAERNSFSEQPGTKSISNGQYVGR